MRQITMNDYEAESPRENLSQYNHVPASQYLHDFNLFVTLSFPEEIFFISVLHAKHGDQAEYKQ